MSTRDNAIHLIQSTYYDGIDAGDMARAATALNPDIDWSHAQVWAHHGFVRAEPSGVKGRQAVHDFLAARVDQLREAQITHAIEDMVLEDGRVVGRGTHDQLLGGCATYQEIVASQLAAEEVA